ncbi:hypothetical protein [Ensifer sp.]|jgi:hypothetical protein|uniref:hypothetical protein n=1 Tax=Ensifer sp. TaxID=1872086 RepID=UPI002E12DF54|nr:hypothetical protein [Ensifer sp.]
MRTIYILIAGIVVGGPLVSIIKAPRPLTPIQQFRADYRADPQAAHDRVETAILRCVPGATPGFAVSKLATVIAPLYVKLADLTEQTTDKERIRADFKTWTNENLQKHVGTLTESQARQLAPIFDQ